jgi:MFS family permease
VPRRSELYILGLLTFIIMFSVTLVYPVLKHFVMDRFDTTIAQASLFVSFNLAGYVIFSLVWGAASDVMGKRRFFITLGFLGNSVLMFSLTLVNSLPMLLILRFIEGAFTIMAFSLIMTKALDVVQRTRYGFGMGIVGMSMAFGNAFGAPIGGRIGNINIFYPLYLGSGLLAFAALLSTLLLRERMPGVKPNSLLDALVLLRDQKNLAIPYAFSFIDRFTVGFFVGVFPLFLGTVHGADPEKIGMYMAMFLIPFALLQYPSGLLSDRIGRTYPLVLGSLFYGICVFAIGFVDFAFLVVPMVIGGVFGALMYPPSAALTGDLAHPAKRGTAMGGFNLLGSLGFAVGPFIGGTIADLYGYETSFAFAGASEILIALLFLPLLLRISKS